MSDRPDLEWRYADGHPFSRYCGCMDCKPLGGQHVNPYFLKPWQRPDPPYANEKEYLAGEQYRRDLAFALRKNRYE